MPIDSNVKKQDYGKEFSVGIYIPTFGFFWLDNSDVDHLYIIEDIYSFVLTGKLMFRDTKNLFEFGSTVGGVEISVRYGVDQEVDIIFQVYRMDRVLPSMSPNKEGKENLIEFTLAEKKFQYLTNQKYSKSWKDEKITKVSQQILEDMAYIEPEKIDIIDPSDENISFVMPYWTPSQALNWILSRGSSNDKWGYCCYTTIQASGKEQVQTHIQTLESMNRKNRLLNDVEQGKYILASKEIYNFNKILSYDISGVDLFSNKQLRGGHVLGYDFERKKLLDQIFNYSKSGMYSESEDVVDNFTMFGDWTLFQGSEWSYLNDVNVNLTHSGESDEDIIKNIYLNDWIKKYSVQNMINITVRGHESRKIGELIHIEWPSSSKDEVYNQNMSGLYLIKNITHYFGPGESPTYRQKIGLIRNSYSYDVMNSVILYPSQKKNNMSQKLIGE